MAIIKNQSDKDNRENQSKREGQKSFQRSPIISMEMLPGMEITAPSNSKTDVITPIIKKSHVNIQGSISLEPLKENFEYIEPEKEIVLEEHIIQEIQTPKPQPEPMTANVEKSALPQPTPLPNPEISQEVLQKELAKQNQQMQKDLDQYKKEAFKGIETEKKRVLEEAIIKGIGIGKKEVDAKLAEKSAEILQTINSIVVEKNKILKKARGEILRLALKVAEQILKSEISLNQAVCVNIVAEAISRVTDKDKVIVRVNRMDADFVKMNKDRFLKQMGDIKNLSIQEDSRVDQGGCIIETDLGYIDATIHTKLETIEKALYKVYEEEEKEEAASELSAEVEERKTE